MEGAHITEVNGSDDDFRVRSLPKKLNFLVGGLWSGFKTSRLVSRLAKEAGRAEELVLWLDVGTKAVSEIEGVADDDET